MSTDDGAVVTCHAGCATESVMTALGLKLADLYDRPRERGPAAVLRPVAGPPAVVARYLYCDEIGELLFTVERLEPGFEGKRKSFRQIPASGRRGAGAMDGVRRVLYRLPEVLQAVKVGLQVYVVEGEKDADRLAELGHVATTNAAGAGRWRPEYAEALTGAYVTVIADDDEPGRRHAREVAASLTAVAASVELVVSDLGKDISEHLQAGGILGDLSPLPPDTDGQEPTGDPVSASAPDVLTGWGRVDLGPYLDGTHVPPEPALLRRRDEVSLLYPGRTHWLSAEPEAGKTWAALLACAQELQAGGRVMYLDLEDGPDSITARLLALGVNVAAILDRFDYRRPSGALDWAKRAVMTDDVAACTLLVIDACTESLSLQGLSGKDDVDVAAWLELLPRWAARLGPAVLVLDHVVKNEESRGRWATGSQHKLAGLDGAAFALSAVQPFGRGMTGRSRLVVVKDRNGQVRPHAVTSAGGRAWIADLVVTGQDDGSVRVELEEPAVSSGDFRPTILMGRICEALTKAGTPLGTRDVLDRVKGKRADQVRQALALLVDEGFVTVASGTRGARLHTLSRPFEQDEQ